MIITTTPNVEGYNITEYLGTVTGAATYLIGGLLGEGMLSSRQSSLFSIAWKTALDITKTAAGNADAIVGVQHTLCGVSTGYMVVSVTGTAVKLVEDPVYKYQIENAKREIEQRTLHSTGQPVADSIKPASHEPIKNDYPDVRTKKDSPKRETELPPIIASPAQREEWDVWICKKCGKVHKSYVIKCPCGGTKEESK